MQLSFVDAELRRMILEPVRSDWPSQRHLEDAQALVADLIAAASLCDVPEGVPDLNTVNVGGFELAAGGSGVLDCRIDHVRVRLTANGLPAWDSIHRLMLTAWRRND